MNLDNLVRTSRHIADIISSDSDYPLSDSTADFADGIGHDLLSMAGSQGLGSSSTVVAMSPTEGSSPRPPFKYSTPPPPAYSAPPSPIPSPPRPRPRSPIESIASSDSKPDSSQESTIHEQSWFVPLVICQYLLQLIIR